MEREYLRNARQKARVVRSYFDDDDDDDTESPRSHARESPHSGRSNEAISATGAAPQAAEIDPLDAFMMGIDAQVTQERAQSSGSKKPEEKPSRFDDDHDSYLEELARSHKTARPAGSEFADSDEEVYATARRVDGDSDDDGGNDKSKKTIEALAPLNHSTITYESFRKCFYKPHAAIAAMSDDKVRALRQELSVATDGSDVPRPIRSFMEAGFDRKMLGQLMKLGLEAPTPIQAQAFPIAMSGRDLIGIAKTGSGKTLAFTLPMVVHVMDQRELRKDEGPIAVVLSPTRELAHQIFTQAKKFLTVYGAQCAAIYGGVGKWDQIQALRKGAEVVVATPGRLIDMIRKKSVRTKRVTFVVLDEADRMFEMGFEPQLRSIMGQIRPDRQTLMFSATFRRRVELLARDVLQDPVKITVGKIGQANEDIHQIAVVLNNHQAKWPWLMANLKKIAAEGRVLIFAGSKVGCEEMTKNLNALQYKSNCLHGDKSQQERNEALAKFKSGECAILVATDVAARGLDVKDVKTVINYDTAKNIDTHTHRIGRTGRMGTEGFEPGTAYTLVTRSETQFAAQLVQNMDVSGQQVMADLLAIAKRDPHFRRGTPARNGASAKTHDSFAGSEAAVQEGPAEPFDEEDEAEMKRWNDSQRKTKADRRQGLGFAPDIGGWSAKGGFQMNFVKGTTEAPPQQPLRVPGFVKAASPQQPPVPGFVRPTVSAPPIPAMPPASAAPRGFPPPPPPPRAFFGAGVAGSTISHRPPPPPLDQLSRIPPHLAQLQSSLPTPVVAPAVLQQQPSAATQSNLREERGRHSSGSQELGRDRRSTSRSPERRRSRRSRSRSNRPTRSRYRSRSRSRSRSHSEDRYSYSRRRRSPSRSRSRSRGRYRR